MKGLSMWCAFSSMPASTVLSTRLKQLVSTNPHTTYGPSISRTDIYLWKVEVSGKVRLPERVRRDEDLPVELVGAHEDLGEEEVQQGPQLVQVVLRMKRDTVQ